jgi:hypothetical protein
MGTEDLKYAPPPPNTSSIFKPDLYKPEMCHQMVEMMSKGATVRMVMAKLDVRPVTFQSWIEKIPEFAEAYERGRCKAQSYFESLENKYIEKDRDNPIELDTKIHGNIMKNRFNIGSSGDTHIHLDANSDGDRLQGLIKQIRGENI